MSAATDLATTLQNSALNYLTKADTAIGKLDRAAVLGGSISASTLSLDSTQKWVLKQLPTPPAIGALPPQLTIDADKIAVRVLADQTNLQKSWMAQFLPTFTDLSALDALFTNVLKGTKADEASAKLDALAVATTSALTALSTSVTQALGTAITASQGNLSTNFATARGGVATALAIAGDNTQNIAWNVARDQVTREAARKERATISQWASRGFNLPGGVLTKLIARSQQDTQDAVTEIAGKQAIEVQKLFFDTARMSVDTYMKQLEVQVGAEVSSYTAAVGANLRLAELTLDANKTNSRIAFEHLQLRVDFTKFAATLATSYRVQIIDAVNGLINAYASLNRSETEYVSSIAAAQRGAYAALTDYYRAAIQYSEFTLKADATNQQRDLQFATLLVQDLGTRINANVNAAIAAANAYGNVASSAISGLNAVTSLIDDTTRVG